MEEQQFLMMVGIAGSGKSTLAYEMMEGREDIVYLSSDELREELLGSVNDQTKNSDVFVEMAKRAKEALKDGKHVIYDATNVSRKKRQGLLQQLPKNIRKSVVYMAVPFKTIVEQNNNRERVVPQEALDRMYKTMQIPIYSEGWNSIKFVYDQDTLDMDFPEQLTIPLRTEVLVNREGYELMKFLASYFDEFFQIYDMPQDSKYHSFSVSRHIYYVYTYILENYKAKNDLDMEVMLWAGLLHDVGKAFCKSFVNRKGEETRHANFIGHEYVGSQLAVNFLKRLGYNDDFIHNVATLIQFHMYLLDKNANRDKLLRRVGQDMFDKLELLREADTLAH
jgi:predicted kinase